MTPAVPNTKLLPTFKAVLWDMDGTLVLSEQMIKKSMMAFHEKIGLPLSEELFAEAIGISYRNFYDTISKKLDMSLGFEEWQAQSTDTYIAMATHIEHREQTAAIVKKLYADGIKQAVVSNSPNAVVTANVRGFLRDFHEPATIFSTIISVDELKTGKPSPEGYLLAAQRLGVSPDECLVIEDSPTGVRAGKAAGMFTIYWPETEPKLFDVTPELTTDDLAALFL